MTTIKLTGVYEGRKYDLESHKHEYRNLMVLLKDQICPEDLVNAEEWEGVVPA